MHVDRVALERARERVGRRGADARALELDALAAVEVAHAGHHHARRVDARRSRPAPRPSARTRRPGTCRRGSRSASSSGVLKSPCASSQTNRASGTWRSTVGSVVMQIEQSEASRTGKSPAVSASSTWPPASSRQPRESRRSSSQFAAPRLAGRADRRSSTPSSRAEPRRQRVDAAHPAGRAVGGAAAQRDDRRAHRPVHSGSRFSKNAFTPSWMSSVANAIASCARR